MKRFVWLPAVLSSAVALGVTSTAVPATYPGDPGSNGPLCADITDGGIVDYDPVTQVLTFGVITSKPSCLGVAYTLLVRDDNTGLMQSVAKPGDKSVDQTTIPPTPLLLITVPNVTPDTSGYANVCVRGQTADDRVFDVAPNDAPCTEFTTAPIPPFGGFH